MLTNWPLDLVLWLQDRANPFFDFVFELVSFLGEEYLYIAVLGLIYWIFNKRFGEVVAMTLATSICFNNVLKDFIGASRPFEDSNLVENKRPGTSTGHAMPSGHVQGSTSFYFAIALFLKRRWLFVVASVITVLMMISRMYLGVHYLQDVLVGAVLGVAIAVFIHWFYRKFEDNTRVLHLGYLIIVLALLPFMFILQGNDFFRGYGILSGFFLAIIFEKKYVNFTTTIIWQKKVLRYMVGLLSMIGVLMIFGELFGLLGASGWTKNLLDFVRYFLVAFVGFGAYPWLFKQLNF